MGRGPIEYIHKAEQLKISEVTERQKLESIRNQKERLQAYRQGQQSRLDSLYARLANLDESKDNDSKRADIMSEIATVGRVISEYESDIQKLISDERATEAKLAEIERSKEQILIEIESNAAVSAQNMNMMYAAIFGEYSTSALRAAASFQRQMSQYSKAAAILGGSISVSGGVGASGSGSRYTASRAAMHNLFEAAAQQRADSSASSGPTSKPHASGGLGGGKPTKRFEKSAPAGTSVSNDGVNVTQMLGGSHGVSVPQTASDKHTSGSVFSSDDGGKSHDATKEYADDNGKVYRSGDELQPNNTFESNGFSYKTDSRGRITSVEGKLRTANADPGRSNMESMDVIGKGDQRSGDDRGHLIAYRFEGSGGMENLVPMDAGLNRGDYKKLENLLANAVKDGADVRLQVEPVYSVDSRRPSSFNVTYTVDGEKTVTTFKNESGDRV